MLSSESLEDEEDETADARICLSCLRFLAAALRSDSALAEQLSKKEGLRESISAARKDFLRGLWGCYSSLLSVFLPSTRLAVDLELRQSSGSLSGPCRILEDVCSGGGHRY